MTKALCVALLLGGFLAACSEYDIHPVNVHPDEVTECPFVATDLPELWAYDCNPVFTTTDEDWAQNLWFSTFAHTEVAGHPFYQLWYVGSPDGSDDYSIGYAVSDNGTDWLPHPDNPGWPDRGDSHWDGGRVQSLEVAWDSSKDGYMMLYGGVSPDESFFGMGLAGSYDGINWELSPNNPVMDMILPIEGVNYAWPLTLDIGQGRYDAYFGGEEDEDTIDIYRIRTDDPENWNRSAERIFRAGDPGAWDDEGVVDASVVEIDGVRYLFYIGFGTRVDQGDVWYVDNAFLGVARSDSTEGSWQRLHEGPLPLSMTYAGDIRMVAARVVGPRIHLWVQDYYSSVEDTAIGYFLYCPDPEDCEQSEPADE